MSAAAQLRRLDESATITVFEEGPYVDNVLCARRCHQRRCLVLHTPKYFKERFNVDVHLNTEVLEVDHSNEQVTVQTGGGKPLHFEYDKLLLSQSVGAIRPRIEGEAQTHVVTLRTVSDLVVVRALLLDRTISDVASNVIHGDCRTIHAEDFNAKNLGKW